MPPKKQKKEAQPEGETSSTAIVQASKKAKTSKAPTNAVPETPLVFERLGRTHKWIGAHVSAAKGLHNAILNSVKIGGQACALFLCSQRKWSNPPLAPTVISDFKEAMAAHQFDASRIIPHGSYLINLGNPDPEKRDKSYGALLEDLTRCNQLGLSFYNLHPGSTVGACTSQESIAHISASINRAHSDTPTHETTILIENMAGQGNVIGSRFEDLRDIIQGVENKKRIGVCLDTCHMFAAGYDIRTHESYNAVISEFDQIVGLPYLKAFHLNDSKGDLGCAKDRHEKIGKGKIGLEPFKFLMNDSRLNGIPMILETPVNDPGKVELENAEYAEEVKLLYSLIE